MNKIEACKQLKERFGDAIIEETTCCDEITLEVSQTSLKAILAYLRGMPEPGFDVLIDLTAVDFLHPENRTQVLYFLYNPISLDSLIVTIYTERLSKIPSVTDLWEGANWYEREIYDFFGLQFEGHPGLTRILMPDDWQGHPLLRDYALTEESVQFKHDVLPKVPSHIITHSKGIYD
jgi:NADH-quinone oxidoreductase subunit C